MTRADSRLGHTTGVVLCGPVHALRAGEDTLAERAARLLAEICEEVLLSGAEAAPGSAGRGIDARLGGGDAALLAAALSEVRSDHVLVLSADRPGLTPDLVIGLAGLPDAPAAMPRNSSGTHPTCARYASESLRGVLSGAGAGGAELSGLVDGLETRWLEGPALELLDADESALERVHDPAEFDAWIARQATRPRGAWPGHPGLEWSRPAV